MSEITISTGHPDAGRIYAEALDRVTTERDAALGREAAALTELSTWGRVLRSSVPEEHKGCFSPVGSVQNYIVDLERRLTAADERAHVLEGLLRDINDAPGGSQFKKHIEAALKPAEGSGDE